MSKEHQSSEYRRNRGIILQGKPTCNYCDKPANTVDHIVAIMNGGGHELDNLQPCCSQCNNRKGKKDIQIRNHTTTHARAEAMRNHAIPIAKTEPFFTEIKTSPPTQRSSDLTKNNL
jgi:5-methylcytosine-specific restriction endonuclease McrA